MNMSADEYLKRICYSSSEDEYLDVSDPKNSDHINLNRRISKMGKNQAKSTSEAMKRKNKKASTYEKEKRDEKENSKEAAESRTKPKERANVLPGSKKPMRNLSSGFITSRRLTTGLTGIFGNSRASDIVKRRGKRIAGDLDNRKTSCAVKEQVNRNLNRIIHPSHEKKSYCMKDARGQELADDDNDEQLSTATFNAVNVTDKPQRDTYSHYNDYRASLSSSSSSCDISNQYITPVTRLAAQTPLLEISKLLKESFIVSKLFPGKRYIEDIKDELRKTYRQDCSLEDELIDVSQGDESRIAPITVVSSRLHRTSLLEEAAASGDREVKIEDENMGVEVADYQSVVGLGEQTEANTTRYDTGTSHEIDAYHGRNHIKPHQPSRFPAAPTSSFEIMSRVIGPIGCNSNTFIPKDRMQPFIGLDRQANTVTTDDNESKRRDCAVAVQRLPYSTSQIQQDSGTYSEESSAREKAAKNQVVTINNNMPNDIGLDSFRSHRKGNEDNILLNSLFCNEMNYPDRHDHDYHMAATNFDILHYAGMNEEREEAPSIGIEEESSSSFAYIPIPKKPCLETPTPPLQLFRLKMF